MDTLKDQTAKLFGDIDVLYQNQTVKIADLQGNAKLAYNRVSNGSMLFHGTDNYQVLTNKIDSLYSGQDVQEGTVGAFLFGCSKNQCSPLCDRNAIPRNAATCTNTKYQWKNGQLTLISQGDNQNISVYSDQNRDTAQNVAAVVKQRHPNYNKIEVYPAGTLATVPFWTETAGTQGPTPPVQKQSGISGWTIFWIIVIVLLLGFLFMWFTKKRVTNTLNENKAFDQSQFLNGFYPETSAFYM